MPGPGRHLGGRRRLASRQRAGTASRQQTYQPPVRATRSPASHGPTRGPTVTPTGGGVKGGSGVTPVGRATRRTDRRIARTESRIGAPAVSTTNLTAARSHLRDLRSAETAIQRVQKALHSTGGSVAGLGIPAQIAHLDQKIGRQEHYPASLLAAQQLHESHFDPGAVSSAGAEGVSQFIPSTAAQYGVKPGTSKKAVKSQIRGQARYMKDLGAPRNAANALGAYLGDHNPNSSYAQGILHDQAKYNALDKSKPKPPKRKDLAAIARVGIPQPKAKQVKAAPPPKPQQLSRFKAIKRAAKTLTKGNVPYVWGGGHGSLTDPVTGLDCSGAVSRVLHAAGILNRPLTSGQMGEVVKPGPGAVTVYYNSGHTFMKIGNKYWGTSVGDSGSGGLGPHPAPSAGYLADYQVGHVPGLGKEAAKSLGVKLGEPGGTTSTSFSAGSVQAGPGFSNSPITAASKKQLAAAKRKMQKVKHFAGKTPLPDLSAEIKAARAKRTGKASGRQADPISAALRKKYGKPAV